MTDQFLLKRFVDDRDQASFAELVARHGAQHWVKDADGKTHEVISQIRMYRADKTLAEVTNWDWSGGDVNDWTTMDPSGKRIVWKVEQRRGDNKELLIDSIVHFEDDDNMHLYQISPQAMVRWEYIANPIGDRPVPVPKGLSEEVEATQPAM